MTDLSLINVTLSGRHHFTEDCEEGEDWCTHCLNPELLVQENGTYYTVIEHHPVYLDSSYEEWQAKCLWGSGVDIFYVEDATLTIEDSVITDVRYKMDSFVWLTYSSLRLIRTQILRMDAGIQFFDSRGKSDSFILIEDCYVTGLNRDHVYDPVFVLDFGLLYTNEIANFTIVRSTFTELILQPASFYEAIIRSNADVYMIADTAFTRCVGPLLWIYTDRNASTSLRNVSVERSYAEFDLVILNTNGVLSLVNLRFLENTSWFRILYALNVGEIVSGVFKNNRHLGSHSSMMFCFTNTNSLPVRVENTVFEGTTAMDSSFQSYWSDYYLEQGLLTDTSLSAGKATALRSSFCYVAVYFEQEGDIEIVNTTFTDSGPACDRLLGTQLTFSSRALFLSEVQFSTQAKVALYINANHDLEARIQNSLFEQAAVLIVAYGWTYLSVTNVTFQNASGKDWESAPVMLFCMPSSFLNCRWRHNQGLIAGALSSVVSVEIQSSEFFNNSGWTGAGDLRLSAKNDYFWISSCTFTASASSLNAASIVILGKLEPSEVSNCTFSEFLSASVSIISATHNSGSLLLSNLTFVGINSPSAILILATVPVVQTSLASTTIVNLQVGNSSFYRGIATDRGNPIIQNVKANFTGNNGAAIWIQAGQFSDSDSVFMNNSGAGLCFFGSDTVSSVNHSLFQDNYINEATGVLYAEGPNVQVSLENCKFSGNKAKGSSGMVQLLRAAVVSFNNCQFMSNEVRISLVFLQASSLFLQQCSASNSSDLLNLEDSTAQVASTDINNVQSTAGLFSLVRSVLFMRSVNFNQINGTGSCLLSAQSSNVSFVDIHIQELACDKGAVALLTSRLNLLSVEITTLSCKTAVINSVNAEINMIDVKITESFAQILRAQNSNISLSSCYFTRIQTNQEVGVLSCTDCDLLGIENTTMLYLEAKSIGALIVSAANVTISHSSFSHISAEDTGGIRVAADMFELFSSNFSNITAKGPFSSGGAVRLSGGFSKIIGSSFEANRAWTGGAVHWISGSLTQQNNDFRDNTAELYGPNWASFPFALRSKTPFVFLHLERKLVVDLVDHFGQVILTDSSSYATLSTNQSAALSGLLQTVASNGQFIFSEFNSLVEPGSNITVTVSANYFSVNVTFVQRACVLGEIYKNKLCELCRAGTYSLILNGTECKLCPVGAECREGYQLFPKPSYWRPHLNFSGALSCPWPDSCEGHLNYTSQTGVCSKPYTGPLCQTCEEGAYRRSRDRCVVCPSHTVLWFQASFLCVGLPVLWGIQAFTSTRENSRLGVLLRLFVDYTQLMALAIGYDLSWPEPLEYFYYLHRYLGNALQVLLPLDCLYSDAFYKSITAAALAPFIIVIFLTIVWGILLLIFKAIRYSVTALRTIFINVVIVGLAYVYPFIVRVALSAFLCETIEPGKQWVRADLTVLCWDKSHLKYALTASLPSLLLWGVGLPALASLYLIRKRKVNHTGFLWRGFKDQFSLWQIGLGLCKALVAVVYALTAKVGPITQALVLAVVISLVPLLQRIYHPCIEAVCNRITLLSLGAIWTTAYAGLYFSATDPSPLLLILVCCIHAWFFLSWITTLCEARSTSLRWVLCLSRK